MTDGARRRDRPAAVRRRAEARVGRQPSGRAAEASAEMRRLVHELEIHQVELEMQNEELQAAQVALAAARDRYADLYDLAPVGHLTLDAAGRIVEANRAACALLGLTRLRLLRRSFALLVEPADRAVLARALAEAGATGTRAACELRLSADGRGVSVVRLDCSAAGEGPGGQPVRHVAVTDITEQAQAARQVRIQQAQLERSQAALRALTRRLMTAQEEERRRIAADLHDDIGQQISACQAELEVLARGLASAASPLVPSADTLRAHFEEIATDLERVARHLHPKIVEDLGLVVALRAHAEEVARLAGIDVRLRERGVPASIPRAAGICLYRVAQEALRNVLRHARALSVTVTIAGVRGGVGLCVADDGRGFDQWTARQVPGRLGLVSMEERALALDGSFRVRSVLHHGTHVHGWVPVRPGGPR